MPAFCLETTNEDHLFWYKESSLIMHRSNIFAIHHENYLAERMLTDALKSKAPLVLTYPGVPFSLPHPPTDNPPWSENLVIFFPVSFTDPADHRRHTTQFYGGISAIFYPSRHIPRSKSCTPCIKVPSEVLHSFITPNAIIVLNWMRKTARKGLIKKKLALAMGLHSRLGCESLLIGLGADLLCALANSKTL
jgi:hypothetical protein